MPGFLDPATLANISGLELVAKTVVDGFVTGLHRSPDFGFSQEFAEYSSYTSGDDLRLVDWNAYARTDRLYLKRFHGETNCQITILMDASASMAYTSHGVTKMDYARYLASSIAYLTNQQRDAAGLMVFREDVDNYIPPSTRGPVSSPGARNRECGIRLADRLQKAINAFSRTGEPARNRDGNFRFLERAGGNCRGCIVVASPRQ